MLDAEADVDASLRGSSCDLGVDRPDDEESVLDSTSLPLVGGSEEEEDEEVVEEEEGGRTGWSVSLSAISSHESTGLSGGVAPVFPFPRWSVGVSEILVSFGGPCVLFGARFSILVCLCVVVGSLNPCLGAGMPGRDD